MRSLAEGNESAAQHNLPGRMLASEIQDSLVIA
jgi:hypothetical protein